MSFSVLAHTIATTANGTTPAIDTTGADLIVLVLGAYALGTHSVSDSQSNSWTELTAQDAAPGDVVIYYCENPTTSGAHTFTGSATTNGVVAALALSGAASSSYDQESGANSGSSNVNVMQPGSITPSADGAILVTGLGSYNGQTLSVDSGFTISDQGHPSNADTGLAYLIQSSAAAINPQWSVSVAAHPMSAAMASFLPDAGGGGVTGTGALVAQGATLSGSGVSESSGSGILAASDAGLIGEGWAAFVQGAAPASDVSAGTWSPSIGADLYAMIDEATPSDVDYDYTDGASTMEVKFGALADPLVSFGHSVQYRLKGDGATDAVVTLKQGATQIAQWTEMNVPAAETTFEHILSTAEADSISDYSDLRLSVEAQ